MSMWFFRGHDTATHSLTFSLTFSLTLTHTRAGTHTYTYTHSLYPNLVLHLQAHSLTLTRRGDSKNTTGSGSSASHATVTARSLDRRGKKPAKVYPRPLLAKPAMDTAADTALAPGTGTTLMPDDNRDGDSDRSRGHGHMWT